MNRRGGLRKSESLDGKENYNSSATSFTKQMEELPDIPSKCCIYRVPPTLRVLNEKVYTPQIVSIGPFHHNKKELKGMEEHKLRCMEVFLRRTGKSLDYFTTAIKGFEKKARNYYAENISLSDDEFVTMLIVDSFFIFGAMIDKETHYGGKEFYVPMHPLFLSTDIILLENQIPFFVLNDLFQLAYPEMSFLKLSIRYIIDKVLVKNKEEDKLLQKVEDYLKLDHEVEHLVDLLRICHLPSPSALKSSPSKKTDEIISAPNAMQLQEAGIQLLKPDKSDSLLDINYNGKDVLKIPAWIVQPWSEIVLCNILVLENCHYYFDSYVRDYVVFMQMLVDTDKDADLLIEKGIIMNFIGRTSTVATLLNKVGPEFLFYSPSYYFYDISKSLRAYCNVRQHHWKATFKRDYCSTPWIIASTMAAVMLLILTFLSTIAAFLAL